MKRSSWSSSVAQSKRYHPSSLVELEEDLCHIVDRNSVAVLHRSLGWAVLVACRQLSCRVEAVLVLEVHWATHQDLQNRCWPLRALA